KFCTASAHAELLSALDDAETPEEDDRNGKKRDEATPQEDRSPLVARTASLGLRDALETLRYEGERIVELPNRSIFDALGIRIQVARDRPNLVRQVEGGKWLGRRDALRGFVCQCRQPTEIVQEGPKHRGRGRVEALIDEHLQGAPLLGGGVLRRQQLGA